MSESGTQPVLEANAGLKELFVLLSEEIQYSRHLKRTSVVSSLLPLKALYTGPSFLYKAFC